MTFTLHLQDKIIRQPALSLKTDISFRSYFAANQPLSRNGGNMSQRLTCTQYTKVCYYRCTTWCKCKENMSDFTTTCRMSRVHKEEYHFVPRTWVLPGEYNTLCYHIRELKQRRRHKTFIIKPHTGAMGNGLASYPCSTVKPAMWITQHIYADEGYELLSAAYLWLTQLMASQRTKT